MCVIGTTHSKSNFFDTADLSTVSRVPTATTASVVTGAAPPVATVGGVAIRTIIMDYYYSHTSGHNGVLAVGNSFCRPVWTGLPLPTYCKCHQHRRVITGATISAAAVGGTTIWIIVGCTSSGHDGVLASPLATLQIIFFRPVCLFINIPIVTNTAVSFTGATASAAAVGRATICTSSGHDGVLAVHDNTLATRSVLFWCVMVTAKR